MSESRPESAADASNVTPAAGPRISVLAPAPLVVVEITDDPGGDGGDAKPTIHMHPGGQGAWVASMAAALGANVSICAPLGGELGEPLRHLLIADGITVMDVGVGAGTGAAVVDLRSGERVEVATMPPPPLDRHDLDDLYGMALVDALESKAAVITGVDPPELVPPDFFGRLVADVRTARIPVVADVAGDAALAVIAEAPTVLKMSHEEVLAAGLAEHDDLATLRAAAEALVERGITAVVISRADKPALLVTANGARLVSSPAIRPVVHRGAGDSMTAGIAVGLARGLDIEDALRLGAAAGTLNVARRGLGSGRREQIERFADKIEVTDAGDTDADAGDTDTERSV
ncbi:PfkB family carbohydrate kinase [Demequina sp. TTPB684]|uniref:1-phosphofructokinase family hexose kinase n=1 Tax=unclassified Demequina TaxID=2620311 RepID=UPI001CF24A52|nr:MULTISPECIES: PfkB family carbohydrate kinase [unclassified Demequina]MCB2412303.1 PfkB family carbohydrate kinase [Demequina sp. TTPB684]UPU87583.1 PfkB family carbohydrate kinase [Demequina sp. TMPB413]